MGWEMKSWLVRPGPCVYLLNQRWCQLHLNHVNTGYRMGVCLKESWSTVDRRVWDRCWEGKISRYLSQPPPIPNSFHFLLIHSSIDITTGRKPASRLQHRPLPCPEHAVWCQVLSVLYLHMSRTFPLVFSFLPLLLQLPRPKNSSTASLPG